VWLSVLIAYCIELIAAQSVLYPPLSMCIFVYYNVVYV